MAFEKINLRDVKMDPIEEFAQNWVLITAKDGDQVNTMTAAWGHIGYVWNKDTVIVYIRPQRYTKQFVDSSDVFTITCFNGHKKELGVLGSKSGRDCDKIAEVGFHLTELEGQPTFEEGTYTLVCKKLYADWLKEECFLDKEVDAKQYAAKDYHMFYVAEVLATYRNA